MIVRVAHGGSLPLDKIGWHCYYMHDAYIILDGVKRGDLMRDERSVAIVSAWQEAANAGEIERLLALSDPEIALVGPRGTAHGHDVLREWVERAGLRLTTLRLFARGEVVVAAQHGVWRSAETGEVVGEADVASYFRVVDGRVARVARFDSLEAALGDGGLGVGDEVGVG
jgi:hypothetical protein